MTLFGTEGVVYKPVKDLDLGPDSDHVYRPSNVQAPRMTGLVVKLFTWVLESRFFGTMLMNTLKKLNLIYKLVSYAVLKESPFYVPSHPWEDLKEQEVLSTQPGSSPAEQVQQVTHCLTSCPETTGDSKTRFQRRTIQEYARAYTSGETTPLMVAERFIAAVRETSNPPLQMSFFIDYSPEDILIQATESTLRYKKGEPISILDGVPIAVKDEIDCMPYPTRGGTTCLHKLRPCKEDAACVKHLRSCGAMIVGKTNMHELGAGTSGINPHYGAPRNPYDPTKISGGSSSGSATVVSAGLCPAALGVDGGGSVRIPASLCGVVGLKPTFGWTSHSGVLPLNWTVGMVGVIAGTVEDSLIVYAAIRGNLPSNRPTLQPKIDFPVLKLTNIVANIKIAKYREWFNDCNDEIKKCCYQALEQLCKHYKWETMEVTIPDIETMRLAHYVTIGSEFNASMGTYLQKLNPEKLGWDTRVTIRAYKSFTSEEYLNAQRIRNRQMHIHEEIFKKANVIVSPTTGVTAYPISDEARKYGEFDYINGAALVRYQIAGNFLGLPAVTVPVGYDKMGMPIGLQFIGRPWSEPTLIHIAYAMQGLCNPSYKKPKVYYDGLKKE